MLHTSSRGLFDLDDLEAAGERGVLLEVFLVLGPRSGGNRTQLATRQRWLQNVCGIVLAGLSARADHGVRFVDEEENLFGRRLDLVDEGLEAVFELALDAGASLEQGHIERMDLRVLERRRHVARRNAVGETFDDRSLTDARFTGENGVVLAAAHQDVDHLPYLGIATQHRIDLPSLGARGQVDGVLVEIRGLAAGRRRRVAGAAGTCCCSIVSRGSRAQRRLPLARIAHDVIERRPQGFRLDLAQFARNLLEHARQFVVRQQREQCQTSAHGARIELDRRQRPRLAQHLHHGWAESRRPRIPAL